MQNVTTNPDQLFGTDVQTQDGETIGSVDNVWVDDATEATEFIGVKTGWLFGKTHVIPTADAQMQGNAIVVPYNKDQIENAPAYDTDAEISPQQEREIYSYYGFSRSTESSPTGLAGGEMGTGTDMASAGTDYLGTTGEYTETTGVTGNTTDLPTPPTEADVTLSEEELAVGKRMVQEGQVRLRKVVRTEHREVPVELRREDIEIERIPAGEVSDAAATGQAFQEQTIEVPLMAEEPVIEKRAHVTGGVRMTKTVDTTTQTVGGDVRSEDVEIEGDDSSDVTWQSGTGADGTGNDTLS
jgi:uncharacterized protein (TIGR02271 family)